MLILTSGINYISVYTKYLYSLCTFSFYLKFANCHFLCLTSRVFSNIIYSLVALILDLLVHNEHFSDITDNYSRLSAFVSMVALQSALVSGKSY